MAEIKMSYIIIENNIGEKRESREEYLWIDEVDIPVKLSSRKKW